VVTPALTQQFSTTGATNGVIWLVDDVEGGNSTVGTIGADGAYAPPASSGTHTVTVRTTDGPSPRVRRSTSRLMRVYSPITTTMRAPARIRTRSC
jgi:hypothetical protein